jgi:hypothetical protein
MNKPITRAMRAGAALGLLSLAGCDRIDPLTRPYMWHATGVNARNIAAMAVNPNDLIRGQDQPRRRAATEADAVDRVWTNKPTPLAGGGGGGAAAGGGG